MELLVIMPDKSESNQLNELAHLIATKKIIPFLGAGTSNDFNPKWNELIVRMEKELDTSKLNSNDSNYFLDVAQLFEKKFGRQGLCNFLKDNFKISKFIDSKGTSDLMLMGNAFPITYTTNFDNVYESMMKKYKRPINVICSANDLHLKGTASKTLIKFHGDYNHPSDLVITKEDYNKRISVQNGLDIMLLSHLMTNSLLFVGYSFRDPDLKNIFLELKNILSTKSTSAYMIAFKYSNSLQQECDRYGIKLIDPQKLFPNQKNDVAFQSYLQVLNDKAQALYSAAQSKDFFSGSTPKKGVTTIEVDTLSRNIKKGYFDDAFAEFQHLYSGPVTIPKDRLEAVASQISQLCEKADSVRQLQNIAYYVSNNYLSRIPNKYLMFKNMIDILKCANKNNISGTVGFLSYGSTIHWAFPNGGVLIVLMAIACSDILDNNTKIRYNFSDYLVNLAQSAYPYYEFPDDIQRYTKQKLTDFHKKSKTLRPNPALWQDHLFKDLHENVRSNQPTDKDISILRRLINDQES